jgi:hypothetical protein
MTLLKSHLFKYQGYISAALVLGGVDHNGPHLFTVRLELNRIKIQIQIEIEMEIERRNGGISSSLSLFHLLYF